MKESPQPPTPYDTVHVLIYASIEQEYMFRNHPCLAPSPSGNSERYSTNAIILMLRMPTVYRETTVCGFDLGSSRIFVSLWLPNRHRVPATHHSATRRVLRSVPILFINL